MTSNRLFGNGLTRTARIARLNYLVRQCEWRHGLFLGSNKGQRAMKWLKVFSLAFADELAELERKCA